MRHVEIMLQWSVHSLPILYDTMYRSSLAYDEGERLRRKVETIFNALNAIKLGLIRLALSSNL